MTFGVVKYCVITAVPKRNCHKVKKIAPAEELRNVEIYWTGLCLLPSFVCAKYIKSKTAPLELWLPTRRWLRINYTLRNRCTALLHVLYQKSTFFTNVTVVVCVWFTSWGYWVVHCCNWLKFVLFLIILWTPWISVQVHSNPSKYFSIFQCCNRGETLVLMECGLWVIACSGQQKFCNLEHQVRIMPLTGIPPLKIPGNRSLNCLFSSLCSCFCESVCPCW